jgi:hypothetical protein
MACSQHTRTGYVVGCGKKNVIDQHNANCANVQRKFCECWTQTMKIVPLWIIIQPIPVNVRPALNSSRNVGNMTPKLSIIPITSVFIMKEHVQIIVPLYLVHASILAIKSYIYTLLVQRKYFRRTLKGGQINKKYCSSYFNFVALVWKALDRIDLNPMSHQSLNILPAVF